MHSSSSFSASLLRRTRAGAQLLPHTRQEKHHDHPPPLRAPQFAEAFRIETEQRRHRVTATASPIPDGLNDNGGWLGLQLAGCAAAGAIVVLGLISIGEHRPTQASAAPIVRSAPTVEVARCSVTIGEFYELQISMSYRQAQKIFGCSGEMVSQVDLGGSNTVMVRWEATNSFLGSATVTFQEARLVARSQFGLR